MLNKRDGVESDNLFLINLLQVIVAKHGHAKVLKAIEKMGALDKVKQKKEIAIEAEPSLNKKDPIKLLVENFDKKHFLPDMNSIKDFLENHGEKNLNFKTRTQAFRSVLQVLLASSEDDLQKILANQQRHPRLLKGTSLSRLAPLSDAIRNSGNRRAIAKQASSAEEKSATNPNDIYLEDKKNEVQPVLKDHKCS